METLLTVPGSRVTASTQSPITTVGRAGFTLLSTDLAGGIYANVGFPETNWWGWGSVSQGSTTPGAPVTVVPWGNRFALFVADPLGGVFTAAGDAQGGWGPWAPVPLVSTTPGAPVTAVPWGKQFALFVANPNGQVFAAVGDPQSGFGGHWGSVSPKSQTMPGAPVTAVPLWGGSGQLVSIALFVADPGGEVFTAVGDPQTHFWNWKSVSQGRTMPGAQVTAMPISGRGGQLVSIALFVADPLGGVFTAVGDPQIGFGNWTSVSQGQTMPGAPVTAVGLRNGVALFVADPLGGVFTAVRDPQTGFGNWTSVSQGRTMPGAPVTAVPLWGGPTKTGSHLLSINLFLADPGGGIYAATGLPNVGYGPWQLVSQFPPTPAAYQLGVLPPEPTPTIPDGDDIILYIHGGPGSRLEESGDLVGQLHSEGNKLNPPKRYTVIAFDQPSQGYTSMLGPDQIVPTHDQIKDHYPTVQFSEDFIVAFVDALDAIVPIKQRNIFIIGGSTGGALALRMGHRSEYWIQRIVAWSAACVWNTYAHRPGEPGTGVALHEGFARSGYGENPGRRGEFFDQAFGATTIPTWWTSTFSFGFGTAILQPNPEEWYRGDRDYYYPNAPHAAKEWPCKWDYIAATRLEYEEVYNWRFRRWHWRLGTELLLFSFFNDDWEGPANTPELPQGANYWSITKPTLLAAAEDDDWDEGPNQPYENRYSRTIYLAQLMIKGPTPGKTLFLPNTGHSIHNERPKLFAQQVVAFLSSPGWKPPFQVVFDQPNPPDEDCKARPSQLSQYPRPRPELMDKPLSATYLIQPANLGGDFSDGGSPGTYSLRLNKALSDVAAAQNSTVAMGHAAARYYRGDPTWSGFADLAVTGRAAYEYLRNNPPTDGQIEGAAVVILAAASISQPDPIKLAEAVLSAMTRAYKVAWVLRDPDLAEGVRLRPAWGWIAVSGEDDSPARPVNVSSGIPIFGPDGTTQISAHPQFEIGVQMPQHPKYYPVSFQVRYSIASPP
jgi:pimeloyl-ACP methyl ester carboxylesterase